jgi:CcmD family protein
MERLQRNFTFLNAGLWVAWLILVIYVLMMVSRERKLKREIDGLKAMLEDKPRS